MKLLEIIELRITVKDYEIIESYLKQLKHDMADKNLQNMKIFSKLNLNTDFSIHIAHESTDVKSGGSELGQHLVFALKEFGLISHSIWVEMKAK